MPRKPEQKLWDRMRTALATSDLRLERVENVVSDGMPDVLVVHKSPGGPGLVTWCELKYVAEAPKRPKSPLIPAGKGLRQSQMNWMLEWTRHGGRSLVVVGCGEDLYVVQGEFADLVNRASKGAMRYMSVASNMHELNFLLRN